VAAAVSMLQAIEHDAQLMMLEIEAPFDHDDTLSAAKDPQSSSLQDRAVVSLHSQMLMLV
jgi:hypothetical protein